MAIQLRDLMPDTRRRQTYADAHTCCPQRQNASQGFETWQNVCVVFDKMKDGFRAVDSGCVTGDTYDGGGVFPFISCSERRRAVAVGVKKSLDCRESCAVAAAVEYRQAVESKQLSPAEGSGFLLPSVLECVKKKLAMTPAQMTTNSQTRFRGASMEDKRYTMRSFRVEGAANQSMDGTAMDALKGYVGWKSVTVARRYVRVTSPAAAGVTRSLETTFIETDALPLPEQSAVSRASYSVPTGQSQPDAPEASLQLQV